MRKTARPVVWEGDGAQSLDPIHFGIVLGFHRKASLALVWTHHSARRGRFPPLYCNAKSCWFQASFGTCHVPVSAKRLVFFSKAHRWKMASITAASLSGRPGMGSNPVGFRLVLGNDVTFHWGRSIDPYDRSSPGSYSIASCGEQELRFRHRGAGLARLGHRGQHGRPQQKVVRNCNFPKPVPGWSVN
jgi:hypothetical protein